MEPLGAGGLVAAALQPESCCAAADAALRGRPARSGGQGRFLLCSFREVLDSMEATACSLREAYSDAVYFK